MREFSDDTKNKNCVAIDENLFVYFQATNDANYDGKFILTFGCRRNIRAVGENKA